MCIYRLLGSQKLYLFFINCSKSFAVCGNAGLQSVTPLRRPIFSNQIYSDSFEDAEQEYLISFLISTAGRQLQGHPGYNVLITRKRLVGLKNGLHQTIPQIKLHWGRCFVWTDHIASIDTYTSISCKQTAKINKVSVIRAVCKCVYLIITIFVQI